MNAATVSRLLSLIPDRIARTQSGVAFMPEGTACKHPDRLGQVAKLLHWLSPLDALSKEDQRVLGLISASGRPLQAEDEEDEDRPGEEVAEDVGADAVYPEKLAA